MFNHQREFEDVSSENFYRFLDSTYSNRWEFRKDRARKKSGGNISSDQIKETVSFWETARRQQAEWAIEINGKYFRDNVYTAKAELSEGDDEYRELIERYIHGSPEDMEYSDQGTGIIEGKTDLTLSELDELLS